MGKELSQRESDLLVGAMLTAQADGDTEAVDALAALARNPDELREVLASVGGGEPQEEQKSQYPSVKPSPFEGRKSLLSQLTR